MYIKKYNICGVDISKAKYDSYFLNEDVFASFSNENKGHESFLKLLRKRKVKHVIMEYTGGYENSLAKYLSKLNIKFSIVHPNKVRAFGKAEGVYSKTDFVDSKLLAVFGRKMQPETTKLASSEVSRLKNLVTRRQQLVEMIVQEKNHAKAPLVEEEEKSSISAIYSTLEVEKKRVEGLILKLIKSNSELNKKYIILTSFSGIGLVAASIILAYLPELGTLDRARIASLVGVAPYNKQSGKKSLESTSIRGGRKIVRDVLYMCTISCLQNNQAIRKRYRDLVSKGKAKKVCIVACLRKVIITLNAMLRDDILWDEERFVNQKYNEVK